MSNNLTRYLPNGNFKPVNLGLPASTTVPMITNTAITTPTSETAGALKKWIAYLLAIVVCIFIILIFVHYTITPIFQLHPGGSGYIPVPGFDDGTLYWQTTTTSVIQNSKSAISSLYQNYSFTIDVFITDPMQFSQVPRILFYRSLNPLSSPTSTNSAQTLTSILPQYNVAVALTPDTNDLIVSVLNSDNNMENILLSNVPVQTPFRLGVVLMERALEVYVNGNLMKTRAFTSPPMAVLGNMYPPSGENETVAKVRNLHIWPRILSPSEIRAATPALPTAASFEAPPPRTGKSCNQ